MMLANLMASESLNKGLTFWGAGHKSEMLGSLSLQNSFACHSYDISPRKNNLETQQGGKI